MPAGFGGLRGERGRSATLFICPVSLTGVVTLTGLVSLTGVVTIAWQQGYNHYDNATSENDDTNVGSFQLLFQ